jgi:hypothetical protein
MSLTASPVVAAPYAAAIHSIGLDDFGHSFRPAAPGLFTCPIDTVRLDALDDRDELRAVLRAGHGRHRRADRCPSAPTTLWAAGR